jgi:hypothetical protein
MRRARPATGLRRLPRRAVLEAGSLGLLGLGLPELLAAERGDPTGHGPGFGRARACILLFMWGGPSHVDTFDPKPDAPDTVRGEFATIATATPGVFVGDRFPLTARVTGDLALVRSLSHDDPAHLSSAHAAVTGQLAPNVRSDRDPPSERDTPHLGCVVSKLRTVPNGLPSFVQMPWRVSHPAAPGGTAPGQHAGWLGRRYDPLDMTGDPNAADWRVPALALREGLSPSRLGERERLLGSLDRQRERLDARVTDALTSDQRRAFSLLASPAVRTAFDVHAEPADVRERYGRNTHGQSVLLARRLVEHGVPLVAVNWPDDGKFFWDTHGNNFPRLRDDLCPPADRALAALLGDLAERGLLDSTLVAWVGEFGRRPQIANAGREHHPYCYTGLFAGGGIRGGIVHGRSDAIGERPAADPVSPHDYAATILHALGVPPATTFADRTGRPHHVYAGRPLLPLFG